MRCWTVPSGTLAPQAAGAIHTDFERGFIKAEVGALREFDVGWEACVREVSGAWGGGLGSGGAMLEMVDWMDGGDGI